MPTNRSATPSSSHRSAEIQDALIAACNTGLHAGDLPAALSTARPLPADDLLGSHSYNATSMQIPSLVLAGNLDAGLRYATRMWDGWLQAGRSPSGWMIPPVAFAALAHQARTVDGARSCASARWCSSTPAPPSTPAKSPTQRFSSPTPYEFPYAWAAPYARAAGAELAVVAGSPDAAERLAAAAGAAEENDWAAACLARVERGQRLTVADLSRVWPSTTASAFAGRCSLP
jgi:hypothetical protein